MSGRRALCICLALCSAPVHGQQASATTAGEVAEAFSRARQQQVSGADGVPLAVVDQGDLASPSVVFIHGYRQSHLSWFRQFGSLLSTHCHLVAYDLRGHGDSGAPWQPEAYDRPATWALDLARVIEATGARRPLIVAWSFGGLVAMDYLREIGNDSGVDIAGVVLVGTTGQLPPAPATPAAKPVVAALAARTASAQAASDAVYGPHVDPAIRAFFATASLRTGPFIDAATIGRAAALTNGDLLPKLRGLPVTLVDGTDDPIVPRAAIVQLKAALPHARSVDLVGSGHAPFVDAPERFDALLEELHCHG